MLQLLSPTKIIFGQSLKKIKMKMADFEPFLRKNGANQVCRARYLTNHLTFGSETLHIYLLPQCHPFSQVTENQISKYQIWSIFYEVMTFFEKSHDCDGEVLSKFSIFSKSVPYLHAMCSPKFRTILIQNGQLRAVSMPKFGKL